MTSVFRNWKTTNVNKVEITLVVIIFSLVPKRKMTQELWGATTLEEIK